MLECNINVDDVDIDVGAKAALRVETWALVVVAVYGWCRCHL